MSLAARLSFQSCLMHRSTVQTYLKYSEWQHKVFKAVDPVLDTINEISLSSNASQETLENIAYARTAIGVVRDVSRVLHIFLGVIPALIYAIKLLYDLIRGFIKHEDVPLNPFKKPEELRYNEIAVGAQEKILVTGAIISKLLQSICSTFAFTICRPILYLRSLGHVQLGKTALAIGNAHSTIMMLKHATGTLGHGCEMGYQYVAFQREVDVGKADHETYSLYTKEMWKSAIGMMEKGLQLTYDVAKMLHSTPPAWFRLPLSLSISGLGIYRVWLKTN